MRHNQGVLKGRLQGQGRASESCLRVGLSSVLGSLSERCRAWKSSLVRQEERQ